MTSTTETKQFRRIKMSEAPTKETCTEIHPRMVELYCKDFETTLNKVKKGDKGSWIHVRFQWMCGKLDIDPDVARYLLLGVNPARKAWGDLTANTGLTPVKFVMRKKVREMGEAALKGHGFKVYFTDSNREGNFDMKVDFYKHKVPADEDSDSVRSENNGKAGGAGKREWVKVAKKPAVPTVTVRKSEFEALKERLAALEKLTAKSE